MRGLVYNCSCLTFEGFTFNFAIQTLTSAELESRFVIGTRSASTNLEALDAAALKASLVMATIVKAVCLLQFVLDVS